MFSRTSALTGLALLATTLTAHAADTSDSTSTDKQANSLSEVFTKGTFSGNFRTFYYSTHNGFFTKNNNQDTISYGGNLAFETAEYYGFSAKVAGFTQAGINHSTNPDQVDGYLGPNLTGLGEAYLKYHFKKFTVVAGNQKLSQPFTESSDWRMTPPLYQGVMARYGDDKNFVTGARIFRYKSYVDNSFTKHTNYNLAFDSYSGITDDANTNGFWSIGAGHSFNTAPATLDVQGWYFTYLDYSRMTYLEGKATSKRKIGQFTPFAGLQAINQTGDGRELLGDVRGQVYGLQLGAQRNSLTTKFGYDRIVPHSNSYLNGVLVTPYEHNVSSGQLFAQPFLTSTQDLGAGNAYAIDVSGAPYGGWYIGGRYSFMDLKSSSDAASLNQSEYLAYAIYNFSGALKGWSISDFVAFQSSPAKTVHFAQNRVELQYSF